MNEDMGPIQSMVRVFPTLPIMQIPINAATTIDMEGPVFLHGWLSPSFASPGPQEFKLVGRARQFSSFLMMIGIMAGSYTHMTLPTNLRLSTPLLSVRYSIQMLIEA